jgi:cytochrome c553
LGLILLGSAYASGQTGSAYTELEAQVLAASCGGCHRDGPSRAGGIPSLLGLSADEIAGKLRAYKSGELDATLMNRLAAGYTDAQIDLLASTLGTEAGGEDEESEGK